MTFAEGIQDSHAAQLAALVRAMPDSHATRDEQADWFQTKAEFFDSVAPDLSGVDQAKALEIAAQARELAKTLRTVKRGGLHVVGESGA